MIQAQSLCFGKQTPCWSVPEQHIQSSQLTSMICQWNPNWKSTKTLWTEGFLHSDVPLGWLLSLSSEPPLDVSVFNSTRLCIFSQSMSKEESMRPFMQMAHWPVGVMERRQPPCHWPPRVMPWKIDGEPNHWLSFQLYHSQHLVTLPGRLAVRDYTV